MRRLFLWAISQCVFPLCLLIWLDDLSCTTYHFRTTICLFLFTLWVWVAVVILKQELSSFLESSRANFFSIKKITNHLPGLFFQWPWESLLLMKAHTNLFYFFATAPPIFLHEYGFLHALHFCGGWCCSPSKVWCPHCKWKFRAWISLQD